MKVASVSANAQDRRHLQDRPARSDSGESSSERLATRSSVYSRREARLNSLSKPEEDASSKDYKKLYDDALVENEKLKARLEESKQELSRIRSQLDRLTQVTTKLWENNQTCFETGT
ncbi:hypothetical protein DNTS_035140, partial [Danionella cerebrum]